jgi:diguanylate cyclase (GGDEF)-like protein/PAS domain S-box-containing protein
MALKFWQFLPRYHPMELQPPAISARRRSDRVAIAFPIEVAGIDLNGKRFSERTKTTTVSRYGCALTLPHELQPHQPVQLRRIGTNDVAAGRVVAPMGIQTDGRLYGVGTRESCESLWGIRFSSSLSEKLLDTVQDGIYFVDVERRITYWNEGAQQLSGYTAAEAVGKCCSNNLLGHVDKNGRALCLHGCQLSQVLADGEPREAEIYLRHKEGYRVPISVRFMPMRDGSGKIVGAVEIFNEPTTKKVEKRVSELEHLAFHDSLTGIPNRRYLEMKVEQGLEEQRRFDRLYGLLMLDLDGFKRVNDSHGHKVGDALLKAVAHTLLKGLRPFDITGRWGGEEFLVLLPDLDAIELGDLAERCRVLIAQSSIMTGAARVSVTASIGATVLSHGDCADSAIRRADELMYQSKHSGGDRTTAG